MSSLFLAAADNARYKRTQSKQAQKRKRRSGLRKLAARVIACILVHITVFTDTLIGVLAAVASAGSSVLVSAAGAALSARLASLSAAHGVSRSLVTHWRGSRGRSAAARAGRLAVRCTAVIRSG